MVARELGGMTTLDGLSKFIGRFNLGDNIVIDEFSHIFDARQIDDEGLASKGKPLKIAVENIDADLIGGFRKI